MQPVWKSKVHCSSVQCASCDALKSTHRALSVLGKLCSEIWKSRSSRAGSNYSHTLFRSNRCQAGKLRATPMQWSVLQHTYLQWTAIWNETWQLSTVQQSTSNDFNLQQNIWDFDLIQGVAFQMHVTEVIDMMLITRYILNVGDIDSMIIWHHWYGAGCRCWSRSATSWGCGSRRWRRSSSRGCLSSLLTLLLWGGCRLWKGWWGSMWTRLWTSPINVSFCLNSSQSDHCTGQHWSALRAMQGWLRDRSILFQSTFSNRKYQTCIHVNPSKSK